jgi:hypothetical protein
MGEDAAEDEAAIVTVGEEQVEVPAGHFNDLIMTRDLVPLEPEVQELKFFARDVGPVLAVSISGGLGIEEVVGSEPDSATTPLSPLNACGK